MGDEQKWTRPDLPSKCTFNGKTPLEQSPHVHKPLEPRTKIIPSALGLIGNTPMVRLNHIPKAEGLECEIIVKCEFLNAAGSVKDRIARRMIDEAERSGQLKPGDTIIEPTSGNTVNGGFTHGSFYLFLIGIGLALVSALRGYRCIIVMPEKMSAEKEYMVRGLGAEIVRTPTSASFDDPDSHLRVAEDILRELGPSAHILNQYLNPYNPIEHFDSTAEEILSDCSTADGTVHLNVLVAGAGTGGTVTGLSRKIKSRVPSVKVVAVDPEGSILAHTTTDIHDPYEVEGIGYDFIPTVLDRNCVDRWYKTPDRDSFIMARRLIREEGLLVGGSSGAAMIAAIRAAHDFKLGKGDRMVVILPDSIRNYMTKFLSDSWMYSRGFIDFPKSTDYRAQWTNFEFRDLLNTLPEAHKIAANETVKKAVCMMSESKITSAVVVDSNDAQIVIGLLATKVLESLLNGSVKPTDAVLKATEKNVRQIEATVSLDQIGRRLTYEPHIIVKDGQAVWIINQSQFLQWTMTKVDK